MGLKENWLFIVTVFLGLPAGFLVAGMVGLFLGWVIRLPPPLERDPGEGDITILHLKNPPGSSNES